MMVTMRQVFYGLKALRWLGIQKVSAYVLYQALLRSGYFRAKTPASKSFPLPKPLSLPSSDSFPISIPDKECINNLSGLDIQELVAQADEICKGQVRLYGSLPSALNLIPPDSSTHWTKVKEDSANGRDIKDIWEPARFGWVFTLGRAYILTNNEVYAQFFWDAVEKFILHNPVNCGSNWMSAQEVSLRMLALLFGWQIFYSCKCSTEDRKNRLIQAIADHANRIPATLSYARAQDNNHLLVEAAGLYTAGFFFQSLPQAKQWKRQGWKVFHQALNRQITAEGEYCQHSLNYHRLMLQISLWVFRISFLDNQKFPMDSLNKLKMATHWLLAQMDTSSGKAPNLGGNDGAFVLPLTSTSFEDYRPTAQAASQAFLGKPAFQPGPWDELCLWLGLPTSGQSFNVSGVFFSPAVHKIIGSKSWASLRAVKFQHRPAHADQLHVEIWWQGINLALDAGTYRYTGPEPWQNALASSMVHNTIVVDEQDQMTRAGKFLWLDWANSWIDEKSPYQIRAQHDGYSHKGIIHQRTLSHHPPNQWIIKDAVLIKQKSASHIIHLHWLIPDFPWSIQQNKIYLQLPDGKASLQISEQSGENNDASIRVIRAGNVLSGPPTNKPVLGWYSPTYAVKIPCLSILWEKKVSQSTSIYTTWDLEPS